MSRNLCSSSNKASSLGKPTNRWKNLYVDTIVLGDGNTDSNIRLIADINEENNPAIQYNVLNNRWQVSHGDNIYGNIPSIYSSEDAPDNSVGVDGDVWFTFGDTEPEPSFNCAGPWKWFKIVFDPDIIPRVHNIVLALTPQDNDGQYWANWAESVALITDTTSTGIVHASSEDIEGDYLAEDAFIRNYGSWWATENNASIGFEFHDSVMFKYMYISINKSNKKEMLRMMMTMRKKKKKKTTS